MRWESPRRPVRTALLFALMIAIGGCAKGDDDDSRPPAPLVPAEIVQVSPDFGGIVGGATIRIITENFRDDFTVDPPRVFFGPYSAVSVTPIGAKEVEAETPAVPAPEVVDIFVLGTGVSDLASLPDAFTYVDATTVVFGRPIPLPSARVVYCLDRGGRMAESGGAWVDRFGNTVTGTRWERAMDGVLASLDGLPDAVQFTVYSFACNRDSFSPVTVPATTANKAAAESWIQGHFAWGGSGDGPGVAAALRVEDSLTVLFPTDGQPDCGATGTTGHLAVILDANTQGANVHTFGIGAQGQFEQFLRDIADRTGGTYTLVVP
jgi:hypothetical protein